MEETDYPIVDAYADREGMLRMWCDYCQKWHFHGQGEGHRVAHCIDDKSPYRKTGYILKYVGAWTPAIIRATQNPDGLRTTPVRLRDRDSEVFPALEASRSRQGVPDSYCLRVRKHVVWMEFYGFSLPPEIEANIRALYSDYVTWWDAQDTTIRRRAAGVSLGPHRPLRSVAVLREHAPWWIALFNQAAVFL